MSAHERFASILRTCDAELAEFRRRRDVAERTYGEPKTPESEPVRADDSRAYRDEPVRYLRSAGESTAGESTAAKTPAGRITSSDPPGDPDGHRRSSWLTRASD
ncbi:hypothetical protein ABH922_003193 [Rhodococcus sp. 27YEA15]|uniref:hypothetical protein n=1 Tax=Rhodococcus sp. 27YEA15 TaxID=3156259 RepID=UPI003C7D503D